MSRLIIGLTGGIASGKTTVANLFAQYNVDIVDADVVAREVVAPNTPALAKICRHFGDAVLQSDGSLNREKLRELVFSSDPHKEWLNALLHPLIREQMSQQLKDATSPYCLFVAPLLIENNLQSMVDIVLVVDSEEQAQLERTISRDNSSEQQVRAIMSSQVGRNKRLKAADDVIKNTGTINRLTNDVKKLHHKYQRLAQDGPSNF